MSPVDLVLGRWLRTGNFLTQPRFLQIDRLGLLAIKNTRPLLQLSELSVEQGLAAPIPLNLALEDPLLAAEMPPLQVHLS